MRIDIRVIGMTGDLDNVDRGILHLLQVDARNTTAQEIAEKTGVSATTVRNRVDELEEDGIITGYHPAIDYEAAGLPLEMIFIITAPPTERSEYVEKLLDIKGIVDVRETITARRNIYAQVVGTSKSDVTRLTDAIHDLGLDIESSEMMKEQRVQPFDHFQYEGKLVGENVE